VQTEWIEKTIFYLFLPVVFAVFRKLAPPRIRGAEHRYDEAQVPEPLPTGLIGAAMWALGLALALLFFALKTANRWWAGLDGPSVLTQYATPWTWCFFPGFAALAAPWPATVWYLRKIGRWEEADAIEDEADSKGRANSYRVMKWLCIGVVCPIAVFTLLAIPIHLSIAGLEVRVGHFASIRSERFDLRKARRLTIVDGYRERDGTFHSAKDLIIDFTDGRRLRGNQVGDGGTNIRDDVMDMLLTKTHLTPHHASTIDDISPIGR